MIVGYLMRSKYLDICHGEIKLSQVSIPIEDEKTVVQFFHNSSAG